MMREALMGFESIGKRQLIKKPCILAKCKVCVLLLTPNLLKSLQRWTFTVCSLMLSSLAISRLDKPLSSIKINCFWRLDSLVSLPAATGKSSSSSSVDFSSVKRPDSALEMSLAGKDFSMKRSAPASRQVSSASPEGIAEMTTKGVSGYMPLMSVIALTPFTPGSKRSRTNNSGGPFLMMAACNSLS